MRQPKVATGLVVFALLFGCSAEDDETRAPTTTAEPSTSASRDPDFSAKAAAITDLIVENDWRAVRAEFNDTMAQQLTEEGLSAAWSQVVDQLGAYQSRGEPVPGPKQGDVVSFDTPLHFERGDMKSRIAFEPDGRVAGLFILAPSAP